MGKKQGKYSETRQLTLDLLEPQELEPGIPGSRDCEEPVKHFVGEAIKGTLKDRHIIAAEMSRDTGRSITHHILNAYTSGKEGNKFPLSYLPAFVAATGDLGLLQYIASQCGCTLLVGRDVEAANLGRIEQLMEELEQERKKIHKRVELSKRYETLAGEEPDFIKKNR
ncbi:MAG: hypothetical protein HQL72_09250 [Magnetococcales bacterium]|nr:hypothetical protein [Magnetococcales bacterium]